MREKNLKLIEHGVESLIVGWLAYLTAWQNYLLYNWHRGLPYPSKIPFFVFGIVVGAGLFVYLVGRTEKKAESIKETKKQSSIPKRRWWFKGE